jgi:arginine/lysine/ornithine decarboxylase
MYIRRETREKARQSLAFSRVSKPHTHITHMLRQCTSIVYLSVFDVLLTDNCQYYSQFVNTENVTTYLPICFDSAHVLYLSCNSKS